MNTATISTPERTLFADAVNEPVDNLVLEKGQTHRWNNLIGLQIEAREGTAWLTQTGLGEDVILTRGMSYRVSQPGRVVVQSLSPRARLVTRRGE